MGRFRSPTADARVLIVDDDARMRRVISRALSQAGHEFTEAGSVQAARESLSRESFDLVICDVRMPGESGMTLVEEVERDPGGPAVLMVSGVDDPDIAHQAVLLGAHGYLIKPFSMNELLINVDAALHHRGRQGRSGHGPFAEEHRVAEVRGALIRLDTEAHLADRQAVELLWPLSEAVGRRDLETGGHIRRIGESSALLADECGLSEADVEGIRLAAPMHDVGKVAIPDSVLLKPGPLDERERELVERHAEIGHDILARSTSRVLKLAAEIALTHHERMDGTGYPRGLGGEDVPIAGRIVAVADVYDALTNDRPYRDALSSDQAVEMMRAERGTHFDPELLDLFLGRLGDVQTIGRTFADHSVAA